MKCPKALSHGALRFGGSIEIPKYRLNTEVCLKSVLLGVDPSGLHGKMGLRRSLSCASHLG